MYVLTHHCKAQAEAKGIRESRILRAAENPTVTYESRNHPGQHRHVRDGIVAIVDRERQVVVTVYLNVERTALRPDQA